MKNLFFDIETGALPETELAEMMPEFEPAANLKDPEKITANIATKKAKWIADAALSPITGQVLCIGIVDIDGTFHIEAREEPAMLKAFWNLVQSNLFDDPAASYPLVGWCCHKFDLPFLIKRSMRHGIAVPFLVRPSGSGRGQHSYWHEKLIDAMIVWQMGDRESESSLETVSRFLGTGRKSGKGSEFSFLWKNDKAAAIAYCENDCRLIKANYERMIQQ